MPNFSEMRIVFDEKGQMDDEEADTLLDKLYDLSERLESEIEKALVEWDMVGLLSFRIEL